MRIYSFLDEDSFPVPRVHELDEEQRPGAQLSAAAMEPPLSNIGRFMSRSRHRFSLCGFSDWTSLPR